MTFREGLIEFLIGTKEFFYYSFRHPFKFWNHCCGTGYKYGAGSMMMGRLKNFLIRAGGVLGLLMILVFQVIAFLTRQSYDQRYDGQRD